MEEARVPESEDKLKRAGLIAAVGPAGVVAVASGMKA
jgi:hypothetical protein